MKNLTRYLYGINIGLCFHYAATTESHVWYIPLGIGILICIIMIADLTSSKDES
jgi:hypothetical protein